MWEISRSVWPAPLNCVLFPASRTPSHARRRIYVRCLSKRWKKNRGCLLREKRFSIQTSVLLLVNILVTDGEIVLLRAVFTRLAVAFMCHAGIRWFLSAGSRGGKIFMNERWCRRDRGSVCLRGREIMMVVFGVLYSARRRFASRKLWLEFKGKILFRFASCSYC